MCVWCKTAILFFVLEKETDYFYLRIAEVASCVSPKAINVGTG